MPNTKRQMEPKGSNKSLSDIYSLIPDDGFRASNANRQSVYPSHSQSSTPQIYNSPSRQNTFPVNNHSQDQWRDQNQDQSNQNSTGTLGMNSHNLGQNENSNTGVNPLLSGSNKNQNKYSQNRNEPPLLQANSSQSPLRDKQHQQKQQNLDLINRYKNSVMVKHDKNKKGEQKQVDNIPNSSIEREIIRLKQEVQECSQQITILKRHIDGNQLQNDIRSKFWEEKMDMLKEKQQMSLQLISLYKDKLILRSNCDLHQETVDEMVIRMQDIMNQMSEDINNLRNFNEMLPSERELELTRENQILKQENRKERETRAELENTLYQNTQSYQHLFVDAQEAKQIILSQLKEIQQKREKLDRQEDDLELQKAEFEQNKRNFLISVNSTYGNMKVVGNGANQNSVYHDEDDYPRLSAAVYGNTNEFGINQSSSKASLYDNSREKTGDNSNIYQRIFPVNNSNNQNNNDLRQGNSLYNRNSDLINSQDLFRSSPNKNSPLQNYEYESGQFEEFYDEKIDRKQKENRQIGVMKLQTMIQSIQQQSEIQ